MHRLTAHPLQQNIPQTLSAKISHPFQEIIQDIAKGNITSQTMLQMEQVHARLHHDPLTLHYIFSKSLQWQLGYYSSSKVNNNLYLMNSDVAQIGLFKLLTEELPHVSFAQNIVNNIIVDLCSAYQHVVLLDIGIGTAHQCSTIIKKLAQNSSSLQEITIVGIEPSAKSLAAAHERLQEVQKETGIRLNFHPINDCVENISTSTWNSLIERYRHQNLVVNASFALHHIKNNVQHPNIREDIFQVLHNFHPIAVLISEPNSNHMDSDFAQRFENCFRHFNFVFQLIDELAVSDNEKSALRLFFGREIKDIIGNQEEFRSERHELATTWIDRLHKANFQLQDNFSAYLPPSIDFISIRPTRKQFLSFEYKQESLVAVMYAIPNQTT